ncbi:hypothetical protein [Rhizocola hellebori]|nr:hypothetical protein [Rhizocola hellebori]
MTLRPLFAWALLAYAGAEIFFIGVSWWLPGAGDNLLQRSYRTDPTTLTTVGLPILALLISAWLKPALGSAKLVAVVALAEYLIILLFGFFTFMLGLLHIIDFVDSSSDLVAAYSHIVFALLGLVIAALCAFTCWRYYSSRDPFTGVTA